jgi:hypothetical protein
MQGFLKCLCLVAWKLEAVGFCGWSGEMLMAERRFSPWRWGINLMQINAIIAWRYDEMDLPECPGACGRGLLVDGEAGCVA